MTERNLWDRGGADEIFRVFTGACPQVLLFPVHMEKEVYRMIRHVGRGQLVEGVRLETDGAVV